MRSTNRRILTGWVACAIWVLSRALMFLVWNTSARFINADVFYYFRELGKNSANQTALIEYPTPILWFLELLRTISGNNHLLFESIFVAIMFSLDAIVTFFLWRTQSRAAAMYWTAFLFATGALVWFRIDLIPGAAVCFGMAWLLRRPFISGAAIAIGAATKLWPALLLLPVLGLHKPGRIRAFGFISIGGTLGGLSLLLAGWQRSISPFIWQADRGLQIESIVASWSMYRQSFDPDFPYRIFLSKYNALEIAGPDTQWWAQLSDVLMVIPIVLAILLAWLIGGGGTGLPHHSLDAAHKAPRELLQQTILTATVALICAVIVANKTFSPQYMLWLPGPLAILVAQQGQSRSDRIHLLGLAGLALTAAFLTQQVFPLNYTGLIRNPHNPPGPTIILLVRNASMVILTLWATWRALWLAWRIGLNPRKQVDS